MKKLIIMLTLLLAMMAGVDTKAADPAKLLDINGALEAYRQATLGKNAAGMLSFVYPGMFKLVPKEQMAKILKEKVEGTTAPNITSIEYGEPAPIEAYSKGQFSRVKYTMDMELTRPGDATPQIDKMVLNMMKAKMGSDTQIVIDEEKNLFKVKRFGELIVLNEAGAGWKMVQKHKMLPLSKILPKDLFARLQ